MPTIPRATVLLTLALILFVAVPSTSASVFIHRNVGYANYTPSPSMPLPAPIPPSSIQLSAIRGVLRVLVIAAAFSDLNSSVSVAQIRQDFFGTVANYYREISYGAVTLQGDVYGWYRLPYPETTYGKDCTGIDDADCSGADGSWQIARDAAALAEKENVNFNNYDYFVFIHSGYGQESSGVKNDVWSVTYLGGVYVQTKIRTLMKFAILPELEAQGSVPIGVYAHEYGHLLGLPDLYNTYTGRTIMGPWSLMDKGLWNGVPPGSSPSHMDAWSKIQLGWISGSSLGVVNAGYDANFTLLPTEVSTNGTHAIEIPVSTNSPPTQYYLVEVRDRVGFDSALPTTGVLITYIDERAYTGRVTVVNGHPDIPGLTDATWRVGQIFADSKNNIAVAITDQTGNAFQLVVDRRSPMPELSVSRIFTQPSTVAPNTTVTIFIDIANQGTRDASNVPIQVSLDGQTITNKEVSVDAGSTSEISVHWTAVAGSHVVKVEIDPLDTMSEMSRTNNIGTYMLNVGGPTLIITVPLNITMGNATAWVMINGVQYYPNNASQVTTSVPSGMVTIQVAPIVNSSLDVRQVFNGWNDGEARNPRQLTIANDTTLMASYKTQYLVTVAANQGITSESGWYDANSVALVSATSPSRVTQGVSRLIFTNWTGDINSDASTLYVKVTGPLLFVANWKLQYYLTVYSPVGSPSGAGWYNAGDMAQVSVQPLIEFQNGTRQVFTGWNGTTQGPTAKFIVNAPTSIQAAWKLQYLLRIQSPYGNPQGSGWYDANSNAQVSIQPEVDYGNRTRRVFAGWTGDYSGLGNSLTLQMNSPRNLDALWATQYQLAFKVYGLPNSTYVKLSLDNATHDISVNNYYQGWFSRGTSIQPTTNQTILSMVSMYKFAGWHNSTGGLIDTPITVTGPQDYTAIYTTELALPAIPGFPAESILAGLITGVLALALVRRRRTRN